MLEYPKAYYKHDGTVKPKVFGSYAGGAASFGSDATFVNTNGPLTSGVGYTVSLWAYWDGSLGSATFWHNLQSGTAGCGIVASSTSTAGNHGQVTCIGPTGKALGTIQTGLPQKTWFNLTLVYAGTGHGDGNGGNVTVYLDGINYGTISNPSKYDLFPSNQPTNMTVGTSGAFLEDELRIYNVALGAQSLCEQVLDGAWTGQNCAMPDLGIHYAFDRTGPVYNRGTWTAIGVLDLGQTPITGVVAGAYTFSTQAGYGYDFAKDSHWTQNTTLTAWFRDTGGKGSIVDTTCTSGDQSCQGRIGGVIIQATGSTLGVCALDQSNQKWCASVPYTMNQWNQIVLVTDEVGADYLTDGVDIYLNGGLVSRLNVNQQGNVWVGSSDYIKIGEGFSGDIDEVKMWGGDLAQSSGDGLCTLAFGGIPDPTNGACKLP